MVDDFCHDFARRQLGANRFCDLEAQRVLALLEDETLFGIAKFADALEERGLVELAVEATERRLRPDLLGHLGIRNAEPELARALVKRNSGDHLVKQLLLE